MKRRHILGVLAAVLLLGGAWQAAAQVRLDFDIPVILGARLNVSDLTGTSTVDLDLSNLHIPLPYLELAYQFGDGWLRGGVGVRSYTVLVEFVGWPMGYLELEPIDRLVLRAELGGFAFFFLGVQNNFFVNDYTLKTLIPDFQVSYAIAPWFRIGGGVIGIAPLGNFGNSGWLFYINARFVLLFK
jgi:hypothetical protein